MPFLDIDRTYADGEPLLESDLDNIKNALTTLNNTTKYDGDNIQDGAIGTTHLASTSVTATELAASSITTSKIMDLGITTAKIADGEVKTASIATSAITTAKIADANVTSAKFSTAARLGTDKISTRYFSTETNASATTITYGGAETTIVSHTVTATIASCIIMLQPHASSTSYLKAYMPSGIAGLTIGKIAFKKNGSTFAEHSFGFGDNHTANNREIRIPISSVRVVNTSELVNTDVISVTLQLLGGGTGAEIEVSPCRLCIIEL